MSQETDNQYSEVNNVISNTEIFLINLEQSFYKLIFFGKLTSRCAFFDTIDARV